MFPLFRCSLFRSPLYNGGSNTERSKTESIKNRLFYYSDFEWFGFRMVVTIHANPSKFYILSLGFSNIEMKQGCIHLKTQVNNQNLNKMAAILFGFRMVKKQNGHISLDGFTYNFSLMVQASKVRFSNGRDLNRATMDHLNTKLVRYSSPHCIYVEEHYNLRKK